MISVAEAQRLMMAAVPDPVVTDLPIAMSFGHFSGADVRAPYDHPLFNCSAVDGYAFRFEDVTSTMLVCDELQAGATLKNAVGPAQCVRIFTGAEVPDGVDTVVMQEYCTREGDTITINDPRIARGGNIRWQGEQIKAGGTVVEKGTYLNASAIGLLASVGVVTVPVGRVADVSIVRTGGEFTEPDGIPAPGRIFSSNDLMLSVALKELAPFAASTIFTARDSMDELRTTLERALDVSQVVICTGGVSVGDHDLVLPVLQQMGAELVFHRVAQKPGKPMLFAKIKDKFVFGLPGNPRAVMVLFWEYVVPFLRAIQGAKDPGLKADVLKLRDQLVVRGDRAEFRAASVRDGQVVLLRDEGSHMLQSLIHADVLAYIPENKRSYLKDDPIEVHWLPK